MKKNKNYFMRLAIIKTMASGGFYLLMPLLSSMYRHLVGGDVLDRYFGYVVFATFILMVGNIILLIRSWALAFDKDFRESYLKED